MLSFPIIKIKRLYIFMTLLCISVLGTASLVLYHIFITTDFPESFTELIHENIELPYISTKNSHGFPNYTILTLENLNSEQSRSGIDKYNKIKSINEKEPVIYKWKQDPECSNFTISFAKRNTFIPRALVSFPGSGNTWIRHLIESSTGLFTGSIYHDEDLIRDGFLGEGRQFNDGTTLIQRTHHFCTIDQLKTKLYVKWSESLFEYRGRGILVIRNPLIHTMHSCPSGILSKQKVTRVMPKSSFLGIDWKTFVAERGKSWADLIQIWIKKSTDLHVVQYEDLKANTEIELLKILKYLEQPVDLKRIKCTLKHVEGHFRRNHVTNKVESPYMQTDMTGNFTFGQIVQNQIKRVNTFLLAIRYPLQLHYKLYQ